MSKWDFDEQFRHLSSTKLGVSVPQPVGMVNVKEAIEETSTVQRRSNTELLKKVRVKFWYNPVYAQIFAGRKQQSSRTPRPNNS